MLPVMVIAVPDIVTVPAVEDIEIAPVVTFTA
jgi:hypothetical protein